MKIEIGESLIYSFLRHEKDCLITQTNWKPSGNWEISKEIRDAVIYEFDKINTHHAFSEIFKSDLNQTLKQTEIDVLGIDKDNHIYAFEVAFHENGLQYGSKIETRNRIFKKLLRGYIALKCYFPNHQHSIAFCSPKVNSATETHIKDYFEVLVQDFQSANNNFYYFSNDEFAFEIAQKTLFKTISEADSSELFVRSMKLFNLTNNFFPSISQVIHQKQILDNRFVDTSQISNVDNFSEINEIININNLNEKINVGNIVIPLTKNDGESVQDFVKKIMRILLNNNLLSPQEIQNLQDKEYSSRMFSLRFPLIRKVEEGYKDSSGRGRYWSREIFGGRYYVCSQWWKECHELYLVKLKNWLKSIVVK